MTATAVQVDFWQLLLAISALLSTVGAIVWTLGKVTLTQVERRIRDQFLAIDGRFLSIEKLIDERFTAVREIRESGDALWQARCSQCYRTLAQAGNEFRQELDTTRRQVEAQAKTLEDLRVHLAEQYVSKEAWMTGLGDLSTKLDRLAARVHA